MLDPRFVAIVRRYLKYLPVDRDLEPDALLQDLGLDSMEAIALMLDLEDEFAASLPDEHVIQETFRTAGTLWAALESAQARWPPAAQQ